jgi:16S rRNA (guanine1207-N2)-methyltransferase
VRLLDEMPVALPPEQAARYRAAWPSADLLAETVSIARDGHVLLLGCAADPLCLVVAARAPQSTCVVADDDAAAGLQLMELAARADLPHVRAVDPIALVPRGGATVDGEFYDTAIANTLYHSSKQMTRLLLAVAHAQLAPGGALYVAGARDRGIVSITDELRAVFGNAAICIMRKGHRVVMGRRGSEAADLDALASRFLESHDTVDHVTVRGQSLALAPSALVFAGGRLDPATALLAETIELGEREVVADLGCGAGIVGMVAARLAPGSQVFSLDGSYAAVRLTSQNAQRNGLTTITALAGDALAPLRERDIRPDVIVTNPPFHAGQVQSRMVTQRFIAEAAERLAPGGRLYLVASRFLPYETELRRHFAQVSEAAGDQRYKVLVGQSAQAEDTSLADDRR